jgi:nucleoside-diphosphate-sugar epimerase
VQSEDGLTGQRKVGVIGASSLVGACLLTLLTQAGTRTIAYSREHNGAETEGVDWLILPVADDASSLDRLAAGAVRIEQWICVAPIWVLPEHFQLLEANGARRIVVLSSTSRFTKQDSSVPEEQVLARRLADAEDRVQAWAGRLGVACVIVRPTLIYGHGQDKNITEIARFIKRFGFFPLLGRAMGARQPVHAEDVAMACIACLSSQVAAQRAYNLSGGETLAYREMVNRVFAALNLRPRLVTIPLLAFRSAVAALRIFPRYRHWSSAMAERMNQDLVFDHADATRDLGFMPRPFRLTGADLPR